jgi:MoaA/NifB/PqqE/SkfB family radical SAM enzyme
MVTIPVEPKITEYLHIKASKMGIPISGTFELTPVCNMNCKMCYVRMSKQEQEKKRPLRSAKEWMKLGEKAKEQGLLYLLLTGGEPFSHPEIREIITGLHKKGFVITINTNATLIDEEVIEWLKDVPPVRVNITLYGASDETYGRLCRNPKGFTQVTKAIDLLLEAGISVKINCSVTPDNVDDLEAIFDYCKEKSLVVQATSYMFPPMRKDASMVGQNERFTPQEAAYYAAKIESLLNGREKYLERAGEKKFTGLLADIQEECMETEGEEVWCRAGKCSFWITWEGQMLPCGMIPDPEAANVFEQSFESCWEQTRQKIAKIRLPAKCKECSLKEECRACAAMVMTESGNFHTVPKYRCEMAQEYPKAFMRLADELRRG